VGRRTAERGGPAGAAVPQLAGVAHGRRPGRRADPRRDPGVAPPRVQRRALPAGVPLAHAAA
jgi:hypothetical protein